MVKVWPFENRVKKYDRFRLAWNICDDERERRKKPTSERKVTRMKCKFYKTR
jgi:hypothetical protein